ncbi:MAG: 4Fe-4S binding protein [Firmicutes bacterium]|nr:4Fe-4S binding protein [Bacillota bacterium]
MEELQKGESCMAEDNRKPNEIMKLREANCRNCYKCVRACPVKAISLLGDHARIEEELCIYCGKCYLVCPQDARDLIGDADRVKMMINAGEKVYVSLSSAFASYFKNNSNIKRMGAMLKKLGFTHVEETGIGNVRIIEEYTKILEEQNMQNVISTICPATNFLIQKFYPQFVKWMIPVDTPLEAHAKMMRKAYGDDIKVVGIGPCLAYQKLAATAYGGKLIDAYINYEELEEWMDKEGVVIDETEDPDTHAVSNYRARYLDEEGGIFRALPADIKYSYKTWEVYGAARTRDMLSSLTVDIENYCMQVSSCGGNCLSGPIVRLTGRDNFEGKDLWLDRIKACAKEQENNPDKNVSELAEVDVRKTYEVMDCSAPEPSEESIQYFLSLIGRKSPEDMLDCSGCGYATCRDKAIAVCRGLADPFMCIPHARDKAEAQSNMLFDYSPMGVVVMDMELKILELNPIAQNILSMTSREAEGKSITNIFGSEFFEKAMLKEMPAVRDTIESGELGKLLDVTFFKVGHHDIVMALIDDITERAEKFGREREMRRENLAVTQEVVEKQMRVAQEIASLLGETTAETKLALNKLKHSLETDEDGWRG